jgi:hypothetical protein
MVGAGGAVEGSAGSKALMIVCFLDRVELAL